MAALYDDLWAETVMIVRTSFGYEELEVDLVFVWSNVGMLVS